MKPDQIDRVADITNRITLSIFGNDLKIRVAHDNRYGDRVFLQVQYECTCLKTGKPQKWNGRKWYLSEFMTDDEIVKTAYAAFEAVVKHEVMEGFKVDGTTLFNPHVDYRELLKISDKEVRRYETTNASTEI